MHCIVFKNDLIQFLFCFSTGSKSFESKSVSMGTNTSDLPEASSVIKPGVFCFT